MCDYPSIYEHNPAIKARKRHRCCECWEVIQPGECYEYFKGLYDGEWQSYKTCLRCAQLRDELTSHGIECVAFTELESVVFEYLELVDRSSLPHSWLMRVHENELEEVGYLPHEEEQVARLASLGRLLKYQTVLSGPKRYQNWLKDNYRKAAKATRLLNYYAKRVRNGEFLNEYEQRQVYRPGV